MADTPTRRSAKQPFWRPLLVALGAILVSAVVFIGLTRTEVGRDGIRRQIEATFNARYHGSLSIGQLSGTLIDDVVATDVELRTGSGELVAAADSIVAEPHWANLLTSQLSVETVTVLRPRFLLRRDSSGTWNLAAALSRRHPSPDTTTAALDLSFADISVRDGRLRVQREGPAPSLVQERWLFDYTNTTVENISLTTSVQRTGPTSIFELRNASFRVPDTGTHVESAGGSLRIQPGEISVRGVDLAIDTTRIRGRATVTSGRGPGPTSVDVSLLRSRIDNDEIRPLVPRLPTASLMTVQGGMKGTVEEMVVDNLTVTHNTSYVTVAGSLSDLATSPQIEMKVQESRLSPTDIREVWPGLPALPDSSIGPVTLTGSLEGRATDPSLRSSPFQVEGQLSAVSPQGAVQGSLAINRYRPDSLRYTAQLETDSFDVGSFGGRRVPSSRMNGRISFEQTWTAGRPGQTDLSFNLSGSEIATRKVASADGNLRLDNNTLAGVVTIRQETGGRLHLEGTADSLDARAHYTATVSASGYDISPAAEGMPSTQLNGQLVIRGRGTDWRSLTGTAVAQVDTSEIYRGDSTVVVPPHSATLQLADRSSAEPRLTLTGPVASLSLDGQTLGPPLWATGRAWQAALRTAIQRELDKPAPFRPFAPLNTLWSPSVSGDPARLQAQSRERLRAAGTKGPLRTELELRVHRADIINAWLPVFPDSSDNLTAEATIHLGPDSIRSSGRLSASHLQFGSDELRGLSADYNVAGRFDSTLVETLRTDATLTASRIQMAGPPLSGVSASLSYASRAGSLRVQADSAGIAGAVDVAGRLHIAPGVNEIQIDRASMKIQGETWSNADSASIRAYSNAIVVTPFSLQRPHTQAPTLQRIRVGGRITPSSTDTLSVTAENVYLPPFSEAVDAPRIIGGNLSGQVHLRSMWTDPKLGGVLSIDKLSYDRRVLGDFRLQAHYADDAPDLELDASLVSQAPSVDSLSGPAFVPTAARTVERNDLSLSGRVHLPSWARLSPPDRASRTPPGESLDLNAKVTRADLFFFRYIFEEHVADIRGFVAGPVHIGGNFRNPIFDADLSAENGAVTLPLFGLQYEASGEVHVDREGIHLRDLTVRDDEGTASVEGSILFNDYEYFSFDLAGTLSEITVINVDRAESLPFYGHIRASGPVTLTGPLPDATLRSSSARTTPESELSIPVSGEVVENAPGFIVFADSSGQIPNLRDITRRENILADRPEGEPSFVEGLNIDINVTAPEGSTVNLVFDPVVGDIVTVVGSGRVQLQRKEGDFLVYGNFDATSGNYLFTAGKVFVRRFSINGGTIRWDGNPINAQLDLDAEYRTRASTAGLPGYENYRGRIPIRVQLDITGRVATPQVDLSLALVRNEQDRYVGSETLDAILNQAGRRTEYATSVLLTNTFLLTTESLMQPGGGAGGTNSLTAAGNQLAFNSVSQLVSSQLNRYLGAAFSNLDVNFGFQGEDPNDLDLVYGLALRLLNDRLVIRGRGVYTGDEPDARQTEGPQGEFVAEFRLSSSVSAQIFYRRMGDDFTRNRALTSSRGAGLSYQTEFSTWRDLFTHLFGWLIPDGPTDDAEDDDEDTIARQPIPPSDSTQTPEQDRSRR